MAFALFKPTVNESYLTKQSEEEIDEVGFRIFKFNHRPKPKKRDRILIISCFSEFGCETVGCMYCIPRLLKRYPGRYIIAMGWHGREYLYRHLVDEFWEIKEEHMWLREYVRAFHHMSDNLRKLEEAASAYGDVIPSAALGKFAVGSYCSTCGCFWQEWKKKVSSCPGCGSTVVTESLFSNPQKYKPQGVPIPQPSEEMKAWAKSFMKPKTVGIFARGRKTYGRNLEPDFYVKLIQLLEQMGYNCIWLGEKQSTQPCPVDHVTDFSRMPEARDLERTLAIISNCEFTVQFWTASTRLAGMIGVPFLLFESPEQIFFTGLMPAQEGKRLELTSFGPRKLVIAHYLNVVNDPAKAFSLVQRAVSEMEDDNYDQIIGMVDDKAAVELMRDSTEELAAGEEND